MNDTVARERGESGSANVTTPLLPGNHRLIACIDNDIKCLLKLSTLATVNAVPPHVLGPSFSFFTHKNTTFIYVMLCIYHLKATLPHVFGASCFETVVTLLHCTIRKFKNLSSS